MSDYIGTPESNLAQGSQPISAPPGITMLTAPSTGYSAPKKQFEDFTPIGKSYERQMAARQSIARYIQDTPDEQAKIDTSSFISRLLDIPFMEVYSNFDNMVKDVTGESRQPKDAWSYIGDKFQLGSVEYKVSKLRAQIQADPNHPRREGILEEIDVLRQNQPRIDDSGRCLLTEFAGATAQQLPQVWGVGKWAVPAVVGTVLSGVGIPGLIGAAVSVASTTASVVSGAMSFAKGNELARGAIFGDLMEMTDEEGNHIDESVARTTAGLAAIPYGAIEMISSKLLLTGMSPIQGLIKKVGKEGLDNLLKKVSAVTINNLTGSGWFRNVAVGMSKNFIAPMAGMMAEEIGEEVAQTQMEIMAAEYAKNLTNAMHETVFLPIEDAERTARFKATVIETAKATFLLSFAHVGSSLALNRLQQAIREKTLADTAALAEEDGILQFAETATDEEYDTLLDEWINQAELEGYKRVTVGITGETATATTQAGTSAGTATFNVQGDEVVISEMAVPNERQAAVGLQLLQEIRSKFSDKKVTFSREAKGLEVLERAVEDSDPILREFNAKIERENLTIEEHKRTLVELEEMEGELSEKQATATTEKELASIQVQLNDIKESIETAKQGIALSETTVSRLYMNKKNYTPGVAKKPWQMKSAEYGKVIDFPEKAKKQFVTTPKGEEFRSMIAKNMPNLTEEETDAAVRMVDLHAKSKGMDTAQWIKKNLDKKVFATEGKEALAQGKKAGVEFLEDGKALLHLTESSDFTSWVHEMGHIFRRELSKKDQKKAWEWAKKEAKADVADLEWNVEMEEVFAEGFERYIYEGKTKHTGMRGIFDQFARFMRMVYDVISDKPEISPEIRAVFENQFSPERMDSLKKGAVSAPAEILFQPAGDIDSKNFKAWFKNSLVEHKDGRPKVVYHGTRDASVIDSFRPESRGMNSGAVSAELGYFFTDERGTAEGYAEVAGGDSVLSTYLSIQNPKIVDMAGEAYNDSKFATIIKTAQRDGNDGVFLENVKDPAMMLIEGTYPDVTVYIAFEPTQIKAVGNTGAYGVSDSRILYQPNHETAVKEAIEQGLRVPDEVLAEYSGKEWAQAERAKRAEETAKIEDFDWLSNIAIEAESYEDFKAEADTYMGEEVKALSEKDEAWYRDFYELVNREEAIVDITTGNREWVANIDDAYVRAVVEDIQRDIPQAMSLGFPRTITAQALRVRAGNALNPKQIDVITKTLKNSPSKFREMIATMEGDVETLNRIEQEKALSEQLGLKDEYDTPPPEKKTRLSLAKTVKDPTLRGKLLSGNISENEINTLLKDVNKTLLKDEQIIQDLKAKIEQEEHDIAQRLSRIEQVRKKEKAEAKGQTKEAVAAVEARYKAQIKEIKKESTRKKNAALKKKIAGVRAKYKQRDQLRKMREHVLGLGNYIKRKVPKSVHIDFTDQIEAIQAEIDPKFRSADTLYRREQDRLFIEKNPEMAEYFDPKYMEMLYKKSLNEMTVEEIENVKAVIEGLKAMGKVKKRAQIEARNMATQETVDGLVSTLLQGKEMPSAEVYVEDEKKLADTVMKVALAPYRARRVADMMDSQANFKGAFHKFFINELETNIDKGLREKHRRYTEMIKYIKDNKITAKDMYEGLIVDGKKWTMDKIMDVYAGWKNDRKQAALMFGNNISEELYQKLMAKLPEKMRNFADHIIDEYGDNYSRLREAKREQTNIDPGNEKNYTPMHTVGFQYSKDEMQVAQELEQRAKYGRTKPWQGMTEKRIDFSPEHQKPITLGLYSAWNGMVAQQEHYISMAEYITKANKVLNNSDVKQAASAMGKKAHLLNMGEYVNTVANPRIYKTGNTLEKSVKMLLNHSSIAYLAFNPLTMLKQVVSLPVYMAYSGPADWLGGVLQFMKNPAKAIQLVESLDIQMKERVSERYIEEMKQTAPSAYGKIVKKIGLTGMRGIMAMDKTAVTMGWLGVYNRVYRKTGSKAEAIQAARQATLHTQPAASAKDIANLYARDGILTPFLQFTNQLNQIFNVITYDIPSAMKNKRYLHTVGNFTGLALMATGLWIITNRRKPETPKDWREIFSDQFISMIPVMGKTVLSATQGYGMSLPMTAPFETIGRTVPILGKAFAGEEITNKQIERLVRDWAEAAGVTTGLPYTMPMRLWKASKEEGVIDIAQTAITGGTWNDNK